MSNKWGTQMQIFIKHILKEHYDNMSFCVDTNILTIQSREETLALWNKLIKEHNKVFIYIIIEDINQFTDRPDWEETDDDNIVGNIINWYKKE